MENLIKKFKDFLAWAQVTIEGFERTNYPHHQYQPIENDNDRSWKYRSRRAGN